MLKAVPVSNIGGVQHLGKHTKHTLNPPTTVMLEAVPDTNIGGVQHLGKHTK